MMGLFDDRKAAEFKAVATEAIAKFCAANQIEFFDTHVALDGSTRSDFYHVCVSGQSLDVVVGHVTSVGTARIHPKRVTYPRAAIRSMVETGSIADPCGLMGYSAWVVLDSQERIYCTPPVAAAIRTLLAT